MHGNRNIAAWPVVCSRGLTTEMPARPLRVFFISYLPTHLSLPAQPVSELMFHREASSSDANYTNETVTSNIYIPNIAVVLVLIILQSRVDIVL